MSPRSDRPVSARGSALILAVMVFAPPRTNLEHFDFIHIFK